MADSLPVGDGLWVVLEPLLPERPARRIGRPRVDDRVAFTAILFVLLTRLPWRLVPQEIGCSGVTAWRRLREWQAAGGLGCIASCSGGSTPPDSLTGRSGWSTAATSVLFEADR